MRLPRIVLAIAVLPLLVLCVFAGDKSTSAGPFRAGSEGVGFPTCLKCMNPRYSEKAREAKSEGAVALSGVVGISGRATKLKVLHSPGLGLDHQAIAAVRGWRFKPALGPNGTPVAVVTTIDVTFRLGDDQRSAKP